MGDKKDVLNRVDAQIAAAGGNLSMQVDEPTFRAICGELYPNGIQPSPDYVDRGGVRVWQSLITNDLPLYNSTIARK